jgi:hypothetical protein
MAEWRMCVNYTDLNKQIAPCYVFLSAIQDIIRSH